MAKKPNRAKTKSTSRPTRPPAVPAERVSETPPAEATPAAPTTPRAPRPAKLNRSQAAAERLEDEYAYITNDLRRVFILAAAMFALLIIVNLAFTFLGS